MTKERVNLRPRHEDFEPIPSKEKYGGVKVAPELDRIRMAEIFLKMSSYDKDVENWWREEVSK